jgi:hypothetical protein
MSDPILVTVTTVAQPIAVTVQGVPLGPTGSPGPTGPAGATGPTGPTGPAGPSISVTGTGWIHATAGTIDGAASTPTYSQVGADPNGSASTAQANAASYTNAQIAALSTVYDPLGAAAAVTTTSIGAVPTSRTVNGYPLTSNVTVLASDIFPDCVVLM